MGLAEAAVSLARHCRGYTTTWVTTAKRARFGVIDLVQTPKVTNSGLRPPAHTHTHTHKTEILNFISTSGRSHTHRNYKLAVIPLLKKEATFPVCSGRCC